MQNRKNSWQYVMGAVLIAVLALSVVGIPGVVQAANFGGPTDNGTANYMITHWLSVGPDMAVPSKILTVSGTGPGTVPLFQRGSDSAGFIIERTATNRWVLGVNEAANLGNGFVLSTIPTGTTSIPRLLVMQDGRVGINTVTPDIASKLNVVLTDNVTNNLAIYGTTTGGKTSGVGGTNEGYSSLGFIGGSSNQTPTAFYGIGAFGANTAYGKSGSLGTPNEGVYGYNGGSGNAAYFDGDVTVTGTLTSGVKDFKIDHPLYPTTKYLIHSSVESPDRMDIYNGSVVLDGNKEAVVQLPAYFEALNKDFQYQLTCIGSSAAVYVKNEIINNSFTIAGDKPGVKVSWQVTGVRHDTWSNANPMQVEVDKASAASASTRQSAAGSGKKGWADWSKPPAMSK